MEQARGLAFSKIQRGMQSSGLSTDPEPWSPAARATPRGPYRLRACAGDKVVSTNLNCPTVSTDCSVPLVPSSGSVGRPQDYPVDYTWHSYVTNNCPAVATGCPAITPYKVTIFVTWTGAGTSTTGVQGVTTQSLFHFADGVHQLLHPSVRGTVSSPSSTARPSPRPASSRSRAACSASTSREGPC